jgi:hypothetical protein
MITTIHMTERALLVMLLGPSSQGTATHKLLTQLRYGLKEACGIGEARILVELVKYVTRWCLGRTQRNSKSGPSPVYLRESPVVVTGGRNVSSEETR